MENQSTELPQPSPKQPHPLFQVTPVSRALAALVFITLPFAAFFFGLNYTAEEAGTIPAAVPQIQQENTPSMKPAEAAVTGKPSQQIRLADADLEGQTLAVTVSPSSNVYGADLIQKDPVTNLWDIALGKITDGRVLGEGVVQGQRLYLPILTQVFNYSEAPDEYNWNVSVVDLKALATSSYPVAGYIVTILPIDDGVLVYSIPEGGICLDSPTTMGKCDGRLTKISSDGKVTVLVEKLPGAKGLFAYSDTKLILRDGYGDAGCSSSIFYEYTIAGKITTKLESFGGCYDESGDEEYVGYKKDLAAFTSTTRRSYPFVLDPFDEKNTYAALKVTGGTVEGVGTLVELSGQKLPAVPFIIQ